MKKTVSILVMLALLCTSLAALADTTNDPVTLTLWYTSTTVEREAYIDSAIAKFQEMYPNVTIETTYLTDTGEAKALAAYSGNAGPDLFRSNITTEYISAGYIIPLDPYFDTWENKNDLSATGIAAARDYDITGNKQLYYLPMGGNPTVLWVRSDWVQEVGGAIDTWDHLFDTIEKMTDKEKGRYGLAIRGGSGGAQFLERMMMSYSGLDSLFDENGKCVINNPKNVEFIERYLGMYNVCTAEGDLGYGWTELSAAFDSGAAGVIIHNLGSASNHVEAFGGDLTKFEATTMPLNEQDTAVNLLKQESGYMISKTCKNPEWAFKLATFMATGDVVSELCRMYGTIPIDVNVLANAEWLKADPWYATAVDMLTSDKTIFYNGYTYLPGLKGIYSEMDVQGQYVMTGEITAQEYLDEWASLMQAEYDAFFKK